MFFWIFLLGIFVLFDGQTVKGKEMDSVLLWNNGGQYVECGDAVYYRQYESDSFQKIGFNSQYFFQSEAKKSIVKRDATGKTEVLFEDRGIGELYFWED